MTRARWTIAVVCTLALAATACSGSSSKSGKSKTTTTTAANARASSVVWLCRPGLADNPCESDETATVVAADGNTRVEHAAPARDPSIDCFYVYPTVSDQPTPVANLTIDPEEKAIALNQASRFSQVCKVYAPMYRQATLAAIASATGAGASGTTTTSSTTTTSARPAFGLGYDDVLGAWRDYLAHDNRGRGVILIGHSQGSFVLIQLLKSEIDPNPSQRRLLVSAMLLGGNVTVPTGRDVGGDFQHVPACHSQTQTGCVVAYSSFLSTPPPNSLFGRAGTRPRAGTQSATGLQVLCVNPASPSGGSGSLLPYFTTSRFPGAIGAVSGPVPSAPTPWVAYPDRYTASCEAANGATWLHITPTTNPNDTRPVVTQTLGPTWGLHLVDVNIALGNLVGLARSEAAAYHR
ncbi:MAG TPA: DUF3089 domain-containing protein [Acidimicrobiia bacterium]|nr:DUF3089 domain-containing protein [Acidimicrobiia bacterium]